jgi:hypothetical protein
MKRLLSTALALALLSGTASYADPFGHGPRGGHHERYDRGWHHRGHHGDDTGAAVAVGFGLLALTAIIAASERDRDQAREQYAPPPPPPPPPGYGPDNGGYDNGYSNDGPGPDDQYYGPDNQGRQPDDGYRPDRQ